MPFASERWVADENRLAYVTRCSSLAAGPAADAGIDDATSEKGGGILTGASSWSHTIQLILTDCTLIDC